MGGGLLLHIFKLKGCKFIKRVVLTCNACRFLRSSDRQLTNLFAMDAEHQGVLVVFRAWEWATL